MGRFFLLQNLLVELACGAVTIAAVIASCYLIQWQRTQALIADLSGHALELPPLLALSLVNPIYPDSARVVKARFLDTEVALWPVMKWTAQSHHRHRPVGVADDYETLHFELFDSRQRFTNLGQVRQISLGLQGEISLNAFLQPHPSFDGYILVLSRGSATLATAPFTISKDPAKAAQRVARERAGHEAARPGQPGWTRARGGCLVWNIDPHPNETVTWSGSCKDGRANGEGTAIWQRDGKEDQRDEGTFTYGKLNGHVVVTWANGNRYDGESQDSTANGHGIFTWANGNHYDGEFQNGKRNGHGIFTWANGNRYDGEFQDGKCNGHGVFTWADGNRYDGDWQDDKPNGPGVDAFPDGRTFSGIWRDGCFEGNGRRAAIGRALSSCP